MNKAAAKEWHQEQKMIAENSARMADEGHLLWQAANKRDHYYPYAKAFRDDSKEDVAKLIEQAYKLLEDAHYLYENTK